MSITKKQLPHQLNRKNSTLWFEKGMALLAALNLLLVLFDLTYIPLRDFWLQGRVQIFLKIGTFERKFPEQPLKILPFRVANWYDWVKGIEPYRDTQKYLKRVEQLNDRINQLALENPEVNNKIILTKAENLDDILKDLRQQSIDIIETNPFQIANKTGTLERIKNKMRLHIFDKQEKSAKEAFIIFWSKENLSKRGFRQELNFFDSEIKPLIETNYYRPIGENGEFIDNFGLIDFPFFIIFGLEFLARSWYISRRHTGISWLDAMLWRWYDIFLLIPIFRWLRIITVTIRLNQAELIDLSAVEKQASQGFVASIAEDLTEVVVIRIINQIQGSISEGQIRNFISQRNLREYIDLNNTNEIVEITKIIAHLIVEEVIPKIRPDVEALLKYTIQKTLTQSPAYQSIGKLPGVDQLQNNLTEQLVTQLYKIFSDALKSALEEDAKFEQLLSNLGNNFTKSIGSEIQAQQSLEKMESLLIDLLEEIKINYVERLSEEDVEDILEQTRVLRQGL